MKFNYDKTMKRILLPLCGVMLALGSCSDPDPINPSTQAVEIEVAASGIPTVNLLASDRVGLYFGDKYKNVEYIIGDDGLLSPADKSIEIEATAKQSLFAYYPYDADRSKSELGFHAEEQDEIETIYWCEAKSSSSNYSLNFKSLYSKVSLSLSNLSDETTTCTLEGATIVGTFDLASGEVTSNDSSSVTYPLLIENQAANLTLSLLPCDDLTNVKFSFEGDGAQEKFYYYPSQTDAEWAVGVTYNHEVALQPTYTAVESLSLNESTLDMLEAVSDDVTLVATVSPANATNTLVKWSSSDRTVALVSDAGVVSAVGEGVATITATSVCGARVATCEVSVESFIPTYPESISLNYSESSIERGEAFQFVATVLPEGADNKTVVWSSSNSDVATITPNGGWLAAFSEGTTTITARSVADSAISASVDVVVSGGTGVALGDYIYAEGGKYLYGSTYDPDCKVLGVVYYVDPTDAKGLSGSIVHLTGSATNLKWTASADDNVSIQAVDAAIIDLGAIDNNFSNMKLIYDNTGKFANHPAMQYVHGLNSPDEDYSGDETGVWVIPSEGNLKDVTGVGLMFNTFGENGHDGESLINNQIAAAGGTKIFAGIDYLTTTEVPNNAAKYRVVRFKTDDTSTTVGLGAVKATEAKPVRPVMVFNLAN